MKLNSYSICRALTCLKTLTESEDIVGSEAELKRLQARATFLVDKLSEMLAREQDVAVLDLYWSNKFVKDIEKVLTDKLSHEVGYLPLETRKLQLYSVQEV